MSFDTMPGKLYVRVARAMEYLRRIVLKPLFRKCGKNVRFHSRGSYSFRSISIGDDVHIARGAKFSARHSTITIGSKVMFGPNVVIRGGNHNTSVVGSFMADVSWKRSEDDRPVEIEDDAWVGACAVILAGVSVRRGTIVAAGAVVTKSTPPYSVVAGVPAKVIKYRWSVEEILEHERQLYEEGARLSPEELAREE